MSAQSHAPTPPLATDDTDICGFLHHVIADYIDMPGLSLTPAQMQRLWSMDRAQCAAVINALVTARILRRAVNGTYVLT